MKLRRAFQRLKVTDTRLFGFKNIEQLSEHSVEENLDTFVRLRSDFPRKAIVASIMGQNEDEWSYLAQRCERAGASAIECNFSCPNMEEDSLGVTIGQSAELVERMTRATKRGTSLPVLAKLTPNVADMVPIALAARAGGADGISAINTVSSIRVSSTIDRSERQIKDALGAELGFKSGTMMGKFLKMLWKHTTTVLANRFFQPVLRLLHYDAWVFTPEERWVVTKRHEIKIAINDADAAVLRQRLRLVARYDKNAPAGGYLVRSLYFDSPTDRALREKLDSVNNREKFRIRCYNRDFSFIQLEKKSKSNSLGEKAKARLSAEEVQSLLAGDYSWMNDATRPVVVELLSKIRSQGLRPKVVVEYRREPFVFGPGNVRVTLDSDVRTSMGATALLDPALPLVPIPGDQRGVLEVKWDAFLPDIIRDAVQLDGRRPAAFSKYAAARMYD